MRSLCSPVVSTATFVLALVLVPSAGSPAFADPRADATGVVLLAVPPRTRAPPPGAARLARAGARDPPRGVPRPKRGAPAPEEPGADPPPPSQALATDRARPGIRIIFGLILRAPFDRSYGLTLDYGASGFFELGTVVALREDRGLELGGSLAFRPFGRAFTSLLVRATAAAIVARQRATAPTAGRIDAGLGYSLLGAGVYFEILAGASYRFGDGYEHAHWAVCLAIRLGVGF